MWTFFDCQQLELKNFIEPFLKKMNLKFFLYFEIFLGPDTVYYLGGGNFGLSLLDFLGL